jgi:hypothetical protein
MSANIIRLPATAQARHAESERNALLEADNRWLEQQLVMATIANDDLARHVIAAEERAEKAERWVRARMLTLTWPAALGGIAGGFLFVGLLKAVGL